MKKQARIFQTQTAMLRVVVDVKNFTKENLEAEVKSTEVFPLGFIFCVDAKDHHYNNIKDQIKADPKRLLQESMILEPGLYEVVAEYRGRVEITKDGEFVDAIWKVFNPHMYQLQDEDKKTFEVA